MRSPTLGRQASGHSLPGRRTMQEQPGINSKESEHQSRVNSRGRPSLRMLRILDKGAGKKSPQRDIKGLSHGASCPL